MTRTYRQRIPRTQSVHTDRILELWTTTNLNKGQIGKDVGLTRERVRQILNAHPLELAVGEEARMQAKLRRLYQTEEQPRHTCVICHSSFTSRRNKRFCSVCSPYQNYFRLMTDPALHERHRLLVLKRQVALGPDRPAYRTSLEMLNFWKQHGHLPKPNRRYTFGKGSTFVREQMGPERWAEMLRKFDDYYANETRQVP